MIAEAPSPSCDSRATALRRKQMAQARTAAHVCAKAVVTGVAFFDFDHGGPILAEDIAAAFRDIPAAAIHRALAALDHDDLLRLRDGQIDVAYPFTASPTPFVIRLPDGAERFACCATDALGIAPMIGQAVQILSRCHHCQEPMEFAASPDGPGPSAGGVMLWIGTRADDSCRLADNY